MKQIKNEKDNGDDMLMIRTILATRMIARTIIMLMTMAMTAVTLMMVITLMMAVKITWYVLIWVCLRTGFSKILLVDHHSPSWIVIWRVPFSDPHDLMMRFCLAAVHLQLQVWPKHWPGGKRLGLDLLGPVATEADRERTYNIPSLRTGNFAAGIVSICQYSSLPGDQSCFPCDDKLHATRSLSLSMECWIHGYWFHWVFLQYGNCPMIGNKYLDNQTSIAGNCHRLATSNPSPAAWYFLSYSHVRGGMFKLDFLMWGWVKTLVPSEPQNSW